MKGTHLKLYFHDSRRHRNCPLDEWLLDEAKQLGLDNGVVYNSVHGIGLFGSLPETMRDDIYHHVIEVVFTVSEEEAHKLLGLIKKEDISLFYVKIPAEYGILKSDNE